MTTILDFLKTFGIDAKTNFDLKDYANYLNLPIKVLMNNELNKIKNSKKHNIIINYQNSDESGSHWVCVKDKYIYFDSYGIKPTKEVESFLDYNYIYNKIQVQPDNTKICGILCLYVLWRLSDMSDNLSVISDNVIRYEDDNDYKSRDDFCQSPLGDDFESIILEIKKDLDFNY